MTASCRRSRGAWVDCGVSAEPSRAPIEGVKAPPQSGQYPGGSAAAEGAPNEALQVGQKYFIHSDRRRLATGASREQFARAYFERNGGPPAGLESVVVG